MQLRVKTNLINWASLSVDCVCIDIDFVGCLALKFIQAKNKMFSRRSTFSATIRIRTTLIWRRMTYGVGNPSRKSHQIAAKVAFPCWLNTLSLLGVAKNSQTALKIDWRKGFFCIKSKTNKTEIADNLYQLTIYCTAYYIQHSYQTTQFLRKTISPHTKRGEQRTREQGQKCRCLHFVVGGST